MPRKYFSLPIFDGSLTQQLRTLIIIDRTAPSFKVKLQFRSGHLLYLYQTCICKRPSDPFHSNFHSSGPTTESTHFRTGKPITNDRYTPKINPHISIKSMFNRRGPLFYGQSHTSRLHRQHHREGKPSQKLSDIQKTSSLSHNVSHSSS